MFVKQLRAAWVMLLILTLITGLIYPLIVTGIAQIAFNKQANGSMIGQNGKTVGSELIGQSFTDPKYFWSRPSATVSGTTSVPYKADASSGSNLGPTNPILTGSEVPTDTVATRIKALHEADPGNTAPIPVDLVTSSASGLDPHISPAAAEYQVARVARVRGLDVSKVRDLVKQYTEGRLLGIFGEAHVNVLELNLALDRINE